MEICAYRICAYRISRYDSCAVAISFGNRNLRQQQTLQYKLRKS